MRRTTLATVLLFAPVIPLIAQSPAPGRFEVASVKPDPKQDRGGPQKFGEFSMPPVRVLPGGSVESYGHTLRNLIAVAYGVNTVHQRIEGKQEILETEFNISAKAAVSSLSSEDALAMVRTLLEERFQLRWRLQPREVDGYVLMPARDDGRPGPGLRPFIGDCDERAKSNARVPFESAEYEELARCGWSGINSRQRAIGVSTKTIAERLTFFMATPVSDGTDWPGLFTFDIMPTRATCRIPRACHRQGQVSARRVRWTPRTSWTRFAVSWV
jgi:uncharacterized protein (TIGR03435 family)